MTSTSDPQQHFGEKRVGKAVREAIERGAPARDPKDLPNLTDMSPESITDNVIAINSATENPRLKFVMEALVRHLHNFTREVSLTDKEWMMALEFLTKTGQTCTDLRQEFILLSDIFGWSALVDSLNHPTPKDAKATEATVLGPFFVEDSKDIPVGGAIASEGKGEYMYVSGRVLDLEVNSSLLAAAANRFNWSIYQGKGVPNCKIETWETDFEGLYDTQYADRTEPDCRGRITTDAQGNYAFRGVRPVAYPIPNDGPVGKLLRNMGRHVFRPAHLHMMLEAPGFEKLITALYPEGDEYIKSDAVFGVKSSLVCKLNAVYDNEKAKALGFKSGPYWDLKWDFVLLSEDQAAAEKRKSLPNYYRFEQK